MIGVIGDGQSHRVITGLIGIVGVGTVEEIHIQVFGSHTVQGRGKGQNVVAHRAADGHANLAQAVVIVGSSRKVNHLRNRGLRR